MNRPTVYDAERLLRRNAFGAGGFLVISVILGFLLFFLKADFSWSMFMMIGIIAVLLIAISMSYAPKATLLGLIFLKPLIDQVWWFRAFAGLNFQAVVGAIVPIIAFTFLFLTRNEFFLRAPMCIWIRRMCYLTFITLYFQGFSATNLGQEFRIISGPALFFLTGWLFTDAEDFKRLAKAVIWSSGWILLGLWVSFLIGKENFSFALMGVAPLEGMFYHKHDLARISTMICLFSLCFVKMTDSKSAKFVCYLLAAIMTFVVFCSYTRATWIAIFICICFWFLWIGKWQWVLVIAPCVVFLGWGTLDKAFQGAHVDLSNVNLTDPRSMSGRTAIWKAQLIGYVHEMNLLENILGGGFYLSNKFPALYSETGTSHDAHSCLPLMLVENGLIFTILYNVLLYRLCRDAWALRKTGDSRLTVLAALFVIGVAYFYISGLTTNSHTYPSLTWYVWGLGGIVYRIRHFPKKVETGEEKDTNVQHLLSRSFARAPLVRPPT